MVGSDRFGWQTIRNARNLAISRARDSKHRAYVTMRETTNRTLVELANSASMLRSFQERVSTAQQRLYLFQAVRAMAVFKNYLAGNPSRSNQILTVTDIEALRGRSYEICITSGIIYLALDSHLLDRM